MTLITPAVALQRLTLREVALVLGIAAGDMNLVDATEIQCPWRIQKDEASAGGSFVEQTVLGRQSCIMTATLWNSNHLSLPDILPGKKIAKLTLLDTEATPVSMLNSAFFTLFPVAGWAFGDVISRFTDKPSTFDIEIIANVIGGATA